MGTTEDSKVFSINTDLVSDNMYEDEADGRSVDLQKCLLCVGSYNHALTLDCQHIFCAPCLRDFYIGRRRGGKDCTESLPQEEEEEEDVSVTCPTCRKTSVKTWGDLTKDLNQQEGDCPDARPKPHKVSNSSIEGIQNCDVCAFTSRTVESEVHCSKCSLSLCQACKDIHGSHLLFKSHPVIHISNKYSVTIYCKKHHKQQSGYYCVECNIPCCVVCIVQDHASHNASLFMDAVTQKKERVKSALNNLGPQLDKLESRLKKIVYYEEMGSRSGNHPGRVRLLRNNQGSGTDDPDYPGDDSELQDEMPLILRKAHNGSNASTPDETPKRKRKFSLFDNDKKRSKQVIGTKSGMPTRKISFFANNRGKKMSDPQLNFDLMKAKRQTSSVETSTSPTFSLPSEEEPSETSSNVSPPPHGLKPRVRPQRTASMSSTHSWHPFVRMGKSSPLMPRRTPSVSSNPEMERAAKNVIKKPKSSRSAAMSCQQQEFLAVPIVLNIDRLQVNDLVSRVKSFRKLYDYAVKSLQMGHSKKVLDFYDLLGLHIRSVADNEVQEVKTSVREIHSEVEKAMSQVTPSASMGSMDLMAAETRKTSGTSSDNSMTADGVKSRELSLLIKPVVMWKTEKHKSDPGELWNRCGVSFLPDGNIVVAEYDLSNTSHNRLHVYDKKGESVRVLCEGQLSPLGVAVTSDGLIAVTDSKSKRVKMVTVTGEIVSEWGKGQFGWPHGIAVSSKGHIIVSDAFNDVISIHHSDGARIRQFGSSGSGNNHFRNPYHLTVDRQDNIIVSDCGNNCIKAFNMSGEFLFTNRGVSATSIDGFEQKHRRLKAPRGVVTDPKGNILVADDNNRVCMFDSRGKYIRNILTEEEGVRYVEGLAANCEGELALTECNPANMIAVKVFHVYTRDIEDGPVMQAATYDTTGKQAGDLVKTQRYPGLAAIL